MPTENLIRCLSPAPKIASRATSPLANQRLPFGRYRQRRPILRRSAWGSEICVLLFRGRNGRVGIMFSTPRRGRAKEGRRHRRRISRDRSFLIHPDFLGFTTLDLDVSCRHISARRRGRTATQAADVRMMDTPIRLRNEGRVWKMNSSRMMAKNTDV
jgi:hypothetical protein